MVFGWHEELPKMFLELLNTLVLTKNEQDVRGVMEVFARKELFNALFASQRPHEGNDTGELQPHPCRGTADCRRRVAAHPVRPGTATSFAEQVGHRRRKEKIRSSVLFTTGLRIFSYNEERPPSMLPCGSPGRLIVCCFCLAIRCAAVSGRNTSAGCAWAAWLFPLSPSACRAGTSIPLPPWRTGT